jgi:hypothetical protein
MSLGRKCPGRLAGHAGTLSCRDTPLELACNMRVDFTQIVPKASVGFTLFTKYPSFLAQIRMAQVMLKQLA